MNGRAFKLGTFARLEGRPFAAIVLDDTAIDLAQAHEAHRASGRSVLTSTASIQDLLDDWERNFATLQEIVAFLDKAGAKPGSASVADLTPRPPICRPGKMFYAAQNFQEHVDEMIRAGMSTKDDQWKGEKAKTRPYLFLKAPSCLAGANDDIEIPRGLQKIDWEAEIGRASCRERV